MQTSSVTLANCVFCSSHIPSWFKKLIELNKQRQQYLFRTTNVLTCSSQTEINQLSLFQALCLLRLRKFLRKLRAQFPARQGKPQSQWGRIPSQWRAPRTLTVMCAQTIPTVTPAKTKQKTTKFLPVKQRLGSVTRAEAPRVSPQRCQQSHSLRLTPCQRPSTSGTASMRSAMR